MRDRSTWWLVAGLVAFAVGCSPGDGRGGPPGITDEEALHGDHGDDLESEDVDDVPPRPLTEAEMERYHAAQLDWRTCAVDDGLELPDPPSLEEFVADGASWWVGYDLSEDEWNRMVGDESGAMAPGSACGEPPLPTDFRVEEDALRRFHAFQIDLAACLAEQGFPLEFDPPTEAESSRPAGAVGTCGRT